MMTGPAFLLGVHEPAWLSRTDVPLFVSHRRLARRQELPRAVGPWALDSGAFSEIAAHGGFATTAHAYAAAVRRYADEVGNLAWASVQDWMCEPFVLARTGLTVAEHQRRTVASYLELRDLAPDVPWVPVVQGWLLDDYLTCVEAYADAGVDLAALPLVGLGSVCRRQATGGIGAVVAALAGLRLHGFGVKTGGLVRYGRLLASADSMAWSYRARRSSPLSGCAHRTCANCLRFALRWRETVIARLGAARGAQLDLFASVGGAP